MVMFLPGVASFVGVEADGQLVDVTIRVERLGVGVRPTLVCVEAEGVAITGTILRGVRVQELSREAIRLGVRRGHAVPGGASASSDGVVTESAVKQLKQRGPVRESLEWAAYVYNVARVLGDPPARAVELAFDMPRTTVSKWVRKAKELGLIEEPNGEHPEAP